MNSGKICISICAPTVSEMLERAELASSTGDLVELRLDCLNEPLDALLQIDSRPGFILTLRPRELGGNSDISQDSRREFWASVSVRCGADLEEDVIGFASDRLDPKICSFHDFSGTPPVLENVYSRLANTSADVIKIAVTANDISDTIGVWKLLEQARSDGRQIIPIAMGEAGKWTRILGLAHGAFLTYAALDSGGETAPGQISARDLIDIYRVKELDEGTEVYGIVAGDTSYSMSPYMHNAAFRSAGLNSVFVPLQVYDLDEFTRRMVRPETREVELNFRGFSITDPHKQAIIKHLDHIDETAEKIGAVNTVKIVDGRLHGYNTDAEGFIEPLRIKFGDLTYARVAVVGAGGAARACIHAFKKKGADVKVLARDINKARSLAKEFKITSASLETGGSQLTNGFAQFDIVVNATPLGTRGPRANETVATANELKGVKLVYDLVYNPAETRLLHEAKSAGAQTLGGFDMLVAQAARQFEIWTGMKAPVDSMSTAARKKLDEG